MTEPSTALVAAVPACAGAPVCNNGDEITVPSSALMTAVPACAGAPLASSAQVNVVEASSMTPTPAEAATLAPATNSQLENCPQYSCTELEQMLRNFRLRRRLALLPGTAAEPDELELRWVRQAWRPPQLLEPKVAEASAGVSASDALARRTQEFAVEVAEMQHRLDRGFSELNALRRTEVALTEGLKKQGGSLVAITAEATKLRGQLAQVRSEVQKRTAANGELARQLGRQRQSQADALTQSAILANAIGQLPVTPQAGTRPGEAVLIDLATCRAQIATLIEEKNLLEQRLRAGQACTVRGMAS